MASGLHKNHVLTCMFFLIAFSQVFGNKILNATDGKYIIQGESGDVFECVDMYKQPAFDHPLLKNHTIETRPSSNPNGLNERNNTKLLLEEVICPEGTIPILTTPLNYHPKASPVIPNITDTMAVGTQNREFAQVTLGGGQYYGAHARIGIWNPAAFDGEFSLAQFWILAGNNQDRNAIEAGWHVFAGDNQPRLFVFWTRNNYGGTGCFNLRCPGFVQTNNRIALGGRISPISAYNGNQYHIELTVQKDKRSGNWWLRLQDQDIGYWPASIFTSLASGGSAWITWGGEIANFQVNRRHTSTQMGSGHFPGEGFRKAAMLLNLGYIDNSGALRDPVGLTPYATKPSCYDIRLGKTGDQGFGVHFYYGGPGYSAQCP